MPVRAQDVEFEALLVEPMLAGGRWLSTSMLSQGNPPVMPPTHVADDCGAFPDAGACTFINPRTLA